MKHYWLRWKILEQKQKHNVKKPGPTLHLLITDTCHPLTTAFNVMGCPLNQWQRFQHHLDIKMAHTYNRYKKCKNKNKLTSFTQSWMMKITSYSFSRLSPYLAQNNRMFLSEKPLVTSGKFCLRILLACLYVLLSSMRFPY